MRFFRLSKKAQSTAEYAILIGLIVAVAIGMQTYVKRGLQGRWHDETNEFYTNLTNNDWSKITDVNVTALPEKQYEPAELSMQSTQETVNNTETLHYDADAAGSVANRTVSRETKQAEGDYRQYDY